MASVYYLFDDALQIADDIVQKYSQRNRNLKYHHLAAIIIQRAYRGYVVRKNLKVMHRAATTLQKYIRGWLVRFELPEVLQEAYDRRCVIRYHKMATKLQSCWKGMVVRREININQIMEAKRKAEEQLIGCGGNLSFDEEKKQAGNDSIEEKDPLDTGTIPGQEKFFKERILYMMFDRHHLLSTKIRKGILKGSSELEEIEKVLASLPWTSYMKKLKKIYNKYYNHDKGPRRPYMFSNKKLQLQEDIFRLFEARDGKKEILINTDDCYDDDKKKPFCLSKKLDSREYKRSLFLEGNYFVPEKHIVRTENKTKNICDQDFVLTLKKIVKESDVPPYYADFWYRECSEHNFID